MVQSEPAITRGKKAAAGPQLVIESGAERGKRYRLDEGAASVVGRDERNTVTIADRLASRRHFRVLGKRGAFHIEDLKSANGTFVNGYRVAKAALHHGDRILAGETRLTFFAADTSDPLIGRVVGGFEIQERIGQGGMGTVYKARQISLDRPVALKVLSKELAENRKFTELFHREARSAGQINHPSIVQVYDVDTVKQDDHEITFLAMEFMAGGSVEELLGREKQLSAQRVVEIGLDTARGLQFAEKHGLVHRDIKPGNLMLGDGGVVKIGDFGIACRAQMGNKVSQDGGISGSPHYMAPEQAKGLDLDSGADMYSLGVTLFHLLAGRPPFVGSSPREIVLKHLKEIPPPIASLRADVPPEVVAVLARLMEKDRERRFPDVPSLVAALERLHEALPGAGAGATGAPAQRRRRLRQVAAGLAVFVLLLLLGSVAGILVEEYRSTRRERGRELRDLKTRLGDELAAAHGAVENGDLARAKALYAIEIAPVLERAARDEERARALSELRFEAQSLREAIDEHERREAQREREADAARRLAKLRGEIPGDVGRSASALAAAIEELGAFAERHPDTGAAERARHQKHELETTRRALQRRLQRAERAYGRVEGDVRLLVSLEPPNFKRALGLLRDFMTNHADTPREADARARLREINAQMEAETRRRIAEARAVADRGRLDVARRRLESLRFGLEGNALELVQGTIDELTN